MTWYAGNNSTNNGSFGWLFEAGAGAVNLIGDDITAGVPVVGASSLTQEHEFDGNDVTTGQPTLGASTLAQEHDLALVAITTGQPVVGSPAVTETTAIALDPVTTGQPTVGASDLAQDHDLALVAITTGVPTVAASTFAEVIFAATQTSVAALMAVDAVLVRQAFAEVQQTATADITAAYTVNASAPTAAQATLTPRGQRRLKTSATTAASVIVLANARYKWIDEAVTAETWTEASASSETWTPAASNAKSWAAA
jgi:hypothetical protein